MRLAQTASRIGAGRSMVLAVVFAMAAGFEIQARFQSATYDREVWPEFSTDPIGGAQVLEYEFTAQYKTAEGLWVFFDFPKESPSEGRLDLTMRRAGEDKPFWSQSIPCRPKEMVFGVPLCRLDGLTLVKGGRYVMTYAMPFMDAAHGWRMRYVEVPNGTSTIKWGGQVRHSAEPSMLWLESEPRYPLACMIACALLLAFWSVGAGKETRFLVPALIVLAAGCVVLAAYRWQLNQWRFWGSFWPDGYPYLSYKLHQFFTGKIPFRECLAFFQDCRTGQAFFVPVVMAALQVLGLSVKGSFLATNALFFIAAVALLVGLLRLYGITNDRPAIAAGLFFFGHPCFIGSVGVLQTDLAGVAGTMLFLYTLLRAFAAETSRTRAGWYVACGVAGFLASAIRIALLPLLFVPACLFVWSLFCERKRPWRERLAYLLPSLIGCALLWASWSALGLWSTLHEDWKFAQPFLKLFSWLGFARTSLRALWLALLLVILLWRRLFDDRGFAAVVGCVAGLLALLAYGHIPPWVRYWSPPAAVGAVIFIRALKEWPKMDRVLLAVVWLGFFIVK